MEGDIDIKAGNVMDEIEHELASISALLRTALEALIDVRVKLAEIRAAQECAEREKQAEK